MQVNLDDRLKAVADLVIPGKTVADIGTDHNYLPVYLIINGVCPFVIATDKSRGSYDKAKQLVDLLSLSSQISVRLGDGLQTLQPGEAQTITISGMGGLLMMDILSAQPDILGNVQRLVLQPQRNAPALRQWLMENGWRIIAEKLAFDHGFYYEIIAAEHGKMQLSTEQMVYGPCLLGDPHPLMKEYLQLKCKDLQTLAEQVASMDGVSAASRLKQLHQTIADIEKLVNIL